jgi:apolipoprotein N-acyltransferase
MESMYEEVTGKKIHIDPVISQSSPQLQEFNKVFVEVIENPDSLKYPRTMAAIYQFDDSLFSLTQSAADKGAQLILWAEANTIIYPRHELGLIEKGKAVARKKNIYLLMAYAVLHPGKITEGKKFMENKTVLIGPAGNILNTFYKNKPVPFAESSIPGDGRIPVINTALGKAAVSICYDADFPSLMKQLSESKSDFLLLPSGDWFAITPHHTYMAVYRAIENGCSLIRNVKGGLSVATDYKGEIYSASNFYDKESKQWIFELPVGHVNTIYSRMGDWVAYLSQLIAAATVLYYVSSFVKRKFINKK